MSRLWWQLPGPARFLDQVERDLAQGRNVILVLPDHPPSGLRMALNGRLKESESLLWCPLQVSDDHPYALNPAGFLHQRLDIPQQGVRISARSLLESGRFRHTLLWLDGITGRLWPVWNGFLKEYADLCRTQAEEERNLFCLPLQGYPADEAEADIGLAVRPWRGMVENLDMELYVATLLRESPGSPLDRRLRGAVITELAGSDEELARFLATSPLQQLLTPQPLLLRFATDRCWNMPLPQPCWHEGTLDQMEGRDFVHSAILACDEDGWGVDEICRRLWRAQVRVLFPYIEEQRARLIKELRHLLVVPFQTDQEGKTVDSLQDLEIGHLLVQIYDRPRHSYSPRIPGLLHTLRALRNSIAHLKPAPPELINDLICLS